MIFYKKSMVLHSTMLKIFSLSFDTLLSPLDTAIFQIIAADFQINARVTQVCIVLNHNPTVILILQQNICNITGNITHNTA